jgi:stage II sporulation protein AB (anti-sigma F factor)
MEISFNAVIENENFARSVIAAFITRYDPTIDEMIEVKTIVAEAVSNAIIHGYERNEDCQVVMLATLEDNLLTIVVQDYGKGIEDIDQAQVPFYSSLSSLEHAGMGLTIIESLTDSYTIISKINMGTKLIMTKRLKEHKIG